MLWRSSGFRITAAVMAVFVLATVLVVGAIYWYTSRILADRDVSGLIAETQALSVVAARDGNEALLSALRERARQQTMVYGLIDPVGKVAWLSGVAKWPGELERDNATAVFAYPRPARSGGSGAGAGDGLAIGATLRLPDGGRLLVARDVTEHQELARTIRNWAIAGLVLLAGLAIVSGWLVNRLLMARLDAMTRTAGAIMAGDLSQRVAMSARHDEFDALAVNLNAMLDRIDTLMQGLREVSDNIAHDLKTPLSRLRIRVEQALVDPRGAAAWQAGLETTLVEADELIRTFNALLRVARLEAGTLGDNLETFDAAALIRDLAEFYEPVIDEAGGAIDVEVDAAVWLRADRQLISQALTNLIENAVKYGVDGAAPGDRVHISIGVAVTGTGADLWVADRGAGIDHGDRERVLKRFVQLDRARSQPSTGLGLSLVAAVVRQHGGRVDLVDNAPGLKVVLHLPAERMAADMLTCDTWTRPSAMVGCDRPRKPIKDR